MSRKLYIACGFQSYLLVKLTLEIRTILGPVGPIGIRTLSVPHLDKSYLGVIEKEWNAFES